MKPRRAVQYHGELSSYELSLALASLGDGVVDFDLETQGLNAEDPTLAVTVLGLAGEGAVLGFACRSWSKELWDTFKAWAQGREFSAFNAAFDFAWAEREGWGFKLYGCSLVLFKMLTTEGFFGQRWSLEIAQEDVLGWPENNKGWLKDALKTAGLTKGEMWRLGEDPRFSEDFVRYCALDAEAARQLRLTCEAAASPQALSFWKNEWNNLILLNIEAQLEGLDVGIAKLKASRAELLKELGALEYLLREESELTPHLREMEAVKESKAFKVHLSTKRVTLPAGEEAPEDVVPLFTGGRWYYEIVTVTVPKAGTPKPRVNFKSQLDLTELLWVRLANGEGRVDLEAGTVSYGGRTVPLTNGGALPVNGAAFGCFGELGKLLDKRSELFTRLGFFNSYLEGAQRSGKIHPKFRAHGTVTSRCSGGD